MKGAWMMTVQNRSTAESGSGSQPLAGFVLREWLPLVSGAGFLLTSLFTGRLGLCSRSEAEVLFILWVLLVAVKGLETHGLMAWISARLEGGHMLPLKLVTATFLLAMVVTNDVSLVVMVPLTLGLSLEHRGLLVILEALAANAGSALTPFGNPQNLFLYWYYDLDPLAFIKTIAPFSLFFLVLLLLAARLISASPAAADEDEGCTASIAKPGMNAIVYLLLLVVVLLSVLRLLPVAAGLAVVLYAVIFDRRTLKVDYGLLLTFFFFFGLADNLQAMLAARLSHTGHIFLLSALASQVISNVPAALMFAKFTVNWKALLWGVNAGGFGSLFGSLANLIAYRLYLNDRRASHPAAFTLYFLLFGYAAFFLACGLCCFLFPVLSAGR